MSERVVAVTVDSPSEANRVCRELRSMGIDCEAPVDPEDADPTPRPDGVPIYVAPADEARARALYPSVELEALETLALAAEAPPDGPRPDAAASPRRRFRTVVVLAGLALLFYASLGRFGAKPDRPRPEAPDQTRDPTRTYYEGALLHGLPQGEGAMIRPDGWRLLGEWDAGQPHGELLAVGPRARILTWSASEIGPVAGAGQRIVRCGETFFPVTLAPPYYDGEWNHGLREGKGLQVEADGTRYDGHWRADQPDGTGVMTLPDGRELAGEWRNGQPVEPGPGR